MTCPQRKIQVNYRSTARSVLTISCRCLRTSDILSTCRQSGTHHSRAWQAWAGASLSFVFTTSAARTSCTTVYSSIARLSTPPAATKPPTAHRQPIDAPCPLCAPRRRLAEWARESRQPGRCPLPGPPSAPSRSRRPGKTTHMPRRRLRSLPPGMTHLRRGSAQRQGHEIHGTEGRH